MSGARWERDFQGSRFMNPPSLIPFREFTHEFLDLDSHHCYDGDVEIVVFMQRS
jgi:hypothetical protein